MLKGVAKLYVEAGQRGEWGWDQPSSRDLKSRFLRTRERRKPKSQLHPQRNRQTDSAVELVKSGKQQGMEGAQAHGTGFTAEGHTRGFTAEGHT